MKFLVQSLHLEFMDTDYKIGSSSHMRHSVLLSIGREGYPASKKVLKNIEKDFA